MDNLSGKVVKSYVLRDLIGAGGFGAVYLAHQSVVERDVAIKIIWPVFANHPNFIRRFESEAQLIAELEHPYIVPLYDYWREPEGAYLVMRYLRGGHLRQAMQDGAWSALAASQLLSQVAAALALAHRIGVVHRDIKPENILLDEEQNAYLADFGIAKILSAAQDTNDEFAAFGSPAYAAPEQVAGRAATPQADIYSLGIVLYEVLTGSHPFPDIATLTLTQLTSERIKEPTPPIRSLRPDLSPQIEAVIQKATAVDPNERYTDILMMARAFREGVESSGAMTVSLPHEGISKRIDTSEINRISDVVPNPYKGLRAFQEIDANIFFGREALIQQLVNSFSRGRDLSRFLAVVGPSGSGKSSVVKAGLIPALRRGAVPNSEHWFYVEMVPSAKPFKELLAALLSVASNLPEDVLERLQHDPRALVRTVDQILPQNDARTELFLVIDQFEELFTLVEHEVEIVQFLNSLYAAVTDSRSRIRVVITLRADFYDRPLLYPSMGELMRKRTEVVVPLAADELERAITAPARQAGVQLEEGLVSAIITEVNQQPGALPLFQYLLSELYERRERNRMTLAAYRTIGGVRGALAKRADELYEQFTPEQQAAVKQLFLRLITLGEGTEDTRRRTLLAEITSITEDSIVIRSVVEALGASRLVAFDRDPITRSPTVEVTHEAILREWKRLREWLDASRSDIRMQRTLAILADEWLSSSRDASFLLRGSRLEQFEKWAESTELALSREEREMLEYSVSERRLRETEEFHRKEREERLERRARNVLRTLVAVLGIAAVGATILTLFALAQSQEAQVERDRAELARATSDANAALSQSLALEASARQALRENNGDLAVALALEAVNVPNPSLQAQRTLSEVVFEAGTHRLIGDYQAWVQDVDISPDDRYILAGSTDATVRLWDRATGQEVRRFVGHRGDVQSVAFSPDGTRAVSGAAEYAAILWNIATGEQIFTFLGHTAPIRAVGFSPDGRYVVSASSDETLIIWDTTTGERVRTLIGHDLSVLSAIWSPDGRYILSGAEDGRVFLWSAADGSIARILDGHESSALDVAFSPDGRLAASASSDTTVILWDVETGAIVNRLRGRSGAVNSVRFTADGMRILSATIDGVLHIWNAVDAFEIGQLRGHADSIMTISVSHDGHYAVTGSKDFTIRVWTLSDQRQGIALIGHTARILDEAFSSDGSRVYTASGDNTTRIWDAVTGEQIEALTIADAQLRALALMPNDTQLLVGLSTGEIRLINISDGSVAASYPMHQEAVVALEISPDGSAFLSGSQDGTIAYASTIDGRLIHRLAGHDGSVFAVDIADDGSRAISAARDGLVIVWDLLTGTPIHQMSGHESAIYSVDFASSGDRALSGDRAGTILYWDTELGTEIRRMIGHTDAVWSVRITSDGERAVSGSVDQSVIMWNLESGSEIQRFTDLGAAVYRVEVSPDSEHFLIGQEGGAASLWRLFRLPELVDWALENRYIRDFTCVERDLYRITPACPPGAIEATPNG